MKKMMLMIFIMMCFLLFLLLMNYMILSKIKYFNKLSPYECGFSYISMKRLSLYIQFYIISIIFLLFDMEVMILIPYFMSMVFLSKLIYMLILIGFILFMKFTLLYELVNKSIYWNLF